MVEEVSEVEKKVHVRVMGLIVNSSEATEADLREFIDDLWSDPDRRYEFHEKCRVLFEESDINQDIKPGIQAEIRDSLNNAQWNTEDEASAIASPRVMSLMQDAGVYKEFGEAAVESRVRAFVEYVLDYLEIPHS